MSLNPKCIQQQQQQHHVRNAIYAVHRASDRLTGLAVAQLSVSNMPVAIYDTPSPEAGGLLSYAYILGHVASGCTDRLSVAALADHAAAAANELTDAGRIAMWCIFTVLFPFRFPPLDVLSPRTDRAAHLIRRLRNGCDWYQDCTACMFCPIRTPYLVQHWLTSASAGGCHDRRVQALRHDLWASLRVVPVSEGVQALTRAAQMNAAVWPGAPDITWCPRAVLQCALCLGAMCIRTSIRVLAGYQTTSTASTRL